MDSTAGTFYIVATPIGNMGDISYRAVETLSSVSAIYAEDTRQFKKLADRYSIKTKVYSYNAHASNKTHQNIVDSLLGGNDIALVSDAGTPGVSDPGSLIISYIRENHPEIKITPIPGASALTAAVSVSGIKGNSFTFLGFAPNKKGRETFFKNTLSSTIPAVFYESTHRIESMLSWYQSNAPETTIMLARELTKMFETVTIDTASNHLENIEQNPKEKKGEFVVIIFT